MRAQPPRRVAPQSTAGAIQASSAYVRVDLVRRGAKRAATSGRVLGREPRVLARPEARDEQERQRHDGRSRALAQPAHLPALPAARLCWKSAAWSAPTSG